MAEEILVTGGAGYIGSHCVLELLQAGFVPVVIDNFHNAIRGSEELPESLRRVQEIAHRPVLFQELDITDEAALQELFRKHRFSAVMHFAGLKAVGESVQKPLEYYRVNLTGTIRLLETMKAHGVRNIVFSSSATVYGDPKYLPLDENHPVGGCTNPYGKSKFFIEEMIRDLCKAERDWNAVLLRYFNPIGAHESGMIGEDPQGIPNNLMPYVAQESGITSTSWIWPRATSLLSRSSRRTVAARSTTWAQAPATPCCRWSGPWRKPRGGRSSTRSRPGGRETWPPATLTPRWPSGSWAGKLPLAWTRCVRTCGGGSCRTPRASARTELWLRAGRALGCSEPALPPSPRAVTILGEQFQLPLLPLARGRKAGASSASLFLIPQVFASHRAEPQQTENTARPGLAPLAWNPLWECPGAAARDT
ncbi:PREDICTED: UDP-glucose 4-epimerase isoform X1 [Pseudopodoces humilis]|uniref:UDP-glucose 4-epimerase isoform X1 n=1 Tax=Pseudopodoces humilis TaxID=181119 RepID=UPI0006B84A12|nr:PREDICTED: UDP-glucose 4-epimerase isoform X1 [Pseudopodoces humilis]